MEPGVLAVIIEFFRGEGDFPGVNDEFVGRTDVFMEHSFGKTDGVSEKRCGW